MVKVERVGTRTQQPTSYGHVLKPKCLMAQKNGGTREKVGNDKAKEETTASMKTAINKDKKTKRNTGAGRRGA